MVATRKIEFEVANLEQFDEAIKNRVQVFLINPKKKTSVRGYLLQWLDRDEGKESALFKPFFKRDVQKVKLGSVYIQKKAPSGSAE